MRGGRQLLCSPRDCSRPPRELGEGKLATAVALDAVAYFVATLCLLRDSLASAIVQLKVRFPSLAATMDVSVLAAPLTNLIVQLSPGSYAPNVRRVRHAAGRTLVATFVANHSSILMAYIALLWMMMRIRSPVNNSELC